MPSGEVCCRYERLGPTVSEDGINAAMKKVRKRGHLSRAVNDQEGCDERRSDNYH